LEKYVALIADIKHSREMKEEERIGCQWKLFEIVNKLNEILSHSIYRKIVFSAGDSIQGLFYDMRGALYFRYLLKNLFHPFSVRCGLGVGTIYQIELGNESDSNYLDGEAYHRATKALEVCKETEQDLLVQSENLENDVLLNQFFHTIMDLERKQTRKQRDVNVLINLLGPVLSDKLIPSARRDEYAGFIKELLPDIIKEYSLDTDRLQGFRFDPKDETGLIDTEKRIFYKEPISPNLHLEASKLLSVSRESVRQTVESGMMNEIRRLEIMVFVMC
jgi:hypothetical protein